MPRSAMALKASWLWFLEETFNKFYLSSQKALAQKMRLQSSEHSHFWEWLLDVGHGRNIDNEGKIELPRSIVPYDEDELINKIYEGIDHIQLDPPPVDYFLDRAILAPWNADVQSTNEKLNKMYGREMICHSADALELQ